MARYPKKKVAPPTDKNNKVMKLYDWCVFNKSMTMRELAKALKVTPATLYSWRAGGDIPLKHLKGIEEFTAGLFPPHFFKPDLILKGSERRK